MQTDVTFFHPGSSWFEADGTLVMGVSRYSSSWRESGVDRFAPDHPDYRMWCSFANAFKASPPSIPFISSEQLDAIREEWRCEHDKA